MKTSTTATTRLVRAAKALSAVPCVGLPGRACMPADVVDLAPLGNPVVTIVRVNLSIQTPATFASGAGGGIDLPMAPARSRLPCKRGDFADHVLRTVGF